MEQRNHSHRFWDKVRDVYPDYRQDRRWLRVNDRSLRFD
ncbi:MAG: YgjP-like metallopeptidase domain-containing protein [Candidatus Omnitrophota bacterium]